MAWTWAGSRGSTNQYKVVHARNGELGVCLDTWGMWVCIYLPLRIHICLSGLPVGHLFPGLEPRKPLLVLAFMCLGVGPTGQGGVVLFVNPGQGGVGA